MSDELRVIFLDFDGVLNSHSYLLELGHHDPGPEQLCTERIARINRICEQTRARIVVSSQWRHGRTVDELRDLLRSRGCTAPIIDRTDVGSSAHRGDQIADWIRDHEVASYVVLDDLGGPCLSPVTDRLVQTDYMGDGLTDEHVERAVNMLEGSE